MTAYKEMLLGPYTKSSVVDTKHKSIMMEMIKNHAVLNDVDQDKNNDEETDNFSGIAPARDKFVEALLNKFLIGSDSPFLDEINLILMMKALPSKIVEYNLEQMSLFNFAILQNSLIAF